jgi:aryl-phospho-beta-D-glucosidase BglC (GH1 family)
MHSVIKAIMAIALSLMSSLVIAATAVQTHGALRVKGNQIVDAHGKPLSLAGPSLFWSNTGWVGNEGRYYNADVVAYVQKNWNAGIIRAAIGGTSKGGYIELPEENMQRAERVIDAAVAQGMYVIVDWHSHEAHLHTDLAIQFFEAIARKYGKQPNIIYEIYNEPLNNADWSTMIKPYAQLVIAKIRAIDPDNLIVVGTQTWSQDVDKAADDPITAFDNIAYALHFYAGSHKEPLRKKAEYAMNKGIALMVTEWGSVNADGNGGVHREETELWLKFMRDHHLTHCNWALSDKNEGASQLKVGTEPDGKWTDDNLTEAGLYVKDIVSHWDKVKYSGAKAN